MFGLPLWARGCWPFTMEHVDTAKYVPADFEGRLERAWAATVWRHLKLRVFGARVQQGRPGAPARRQS